MRWQAGCNRSGGGRGRSFPLTRAVRSSGSTSRPSCLRPSKLRPVWTNRCPPEVPFKTDCAASMARPRAGARGWVLTEVTKCHLVPNRTLIRGCAGTPLFSTTPVRTRLVRMVAFGGELIISHSTERQESIRIPPPWAIRILIHVVLRDSTRPLGSIPAVGAVEG